MIVRDEVDLLPGCLKSIKDFVDEIVIIDTGSTDNTVAIAESFGAKVYHFDWCDDFSAARNYALSKVTTEWTLWLDADDLVENPHIIPKLMELKDCAGFWSVYKQDQTSQQRRLQLFKTKEFKWEGVVHESARPSDPEYSSTRLSNLVVLHRKPKSRSDSAARKYLAILQEKDPENWFGIAESYRFLSSETEPTNENIIAAISCYSKAMQHPQVNHSTKYICFVNQARLALRLYESDQEAQWLTYAHKCAHAAVQLDENRAEGWSLQAQAELYSGDKANANESVQYALKCPEPENSTGLYYYDFYYEHPKAIQTLLNNGA